MTKEEALFKLIPLLVDNRSLSKEDLADRLETTTRSISRYIAELEELGFNVEKSQRIYSIRLDSPFIKLLTKKVRFSGSNLATLIALLHEADSFNPAIRNLRAQFNNIYGTENFSGVRLDKMFSQNIDNIYKAITENKKAILHGYYSPNSQSKKDRLVEPFKFVMNDSSVRCYEIESGICKTFKIARITEGITVLDEEWNHKTKHTNFYTDLFGFSGETLYRVKLRLGILSSRILCEEYGVRMEDLVIDDDTHWIFATKVCSFQGIGRFVMGLWNDIDILEGEAFKTDLVSKLDLLTQKLKGQQ